MKQNIVYEIINKLNNHRYVGSTCEGRPHWDRHKYLLRRNKHHNSVLQAVWLLYGEGAFCFNILEICTAREMLLEREQFYMDTLMPEYNVAKLAGSNRGVRFEDSDETRLHKRQGHLGIKFTEEHKHNMALAATDKHHSVGTNNGRSKLTEQDIADIRSRYATGNITQTELGRIYGVRQTQISNIVRCVQWNSIT
jgi:group I intron endonuclease